MGARTWHISGELERLRSLSDKQRRGYDFQRFLGEVFRAEHFRVEPNAGTARPRQVDLLAKRGHDTFLVEAKWRKRKADIDAVDSLLTRLDAAPAGVVGVLISDSGFTTSAVDRVREKSATPIVLLSGQEIEAVVAQSGSLSRLLRRKVEHLLRHREVLIDVYESSHPRRKNKRIGGAALPGSNRGFNLNGDAMPSLISGGSFGRFVFVSTLPDNDWHSDGGFSVRLDMPLSPHDLAGVARAFDALDRRGWLTDDAQWSIQQSTMNWHGLGAKAFVDEINSWKKRYRNIPIADIHHTEEFCYFDVCDDGYFTLTGQLSADSSRAAWQLNLCVELAGIPLDTDPYRDLSDELEGIAPIHFRPLDGPTVTRHRLDDAYRSPLDVVGFVTEPMDGEAEWVVGLIVRNDIGAARPEWWPDILGDSELLICDLSSWHPVGKTRRIYRMRSVETTSSSEARLVRLVADWDDLAKKRRESSPKTVRSRREKSDELLGDG